MSSQFTNKIVTTLETFGFIKIKCLTFFRRLGAHIKAEKLYEVYRIDDK